MTKYSKGFKEEAIKLSDEIGNKRAALLHPCRLAKPQQAYYRWLKNRRKPSSRQLLSVEIAKILSEHPDNDNYGIHRIELALEQKNSPSVIVIAVPCTAQTLYHSGASQVQRLLTFRSP